MSVGCLLCRDNAPTHEKGTRGNPRAFQKYSEQLYITDYLYCIFDIAYIVLNACFINYYRIIFTNKCCVSKMACSYISITIDIYIYIFAILICTNNMSGYGDTYMRINVILIIALRAYIYCFAFIFYHRIEIATHDFRPWHNNFSTSRKQNIIHQTYGCCFARTLIAS